MDIKTIFVLGHLVGLVIGLGAVTLLDIYLLRLLRGKPVSAADASLVDFGSKLAMIGLGILWFTGAAFLVIYAIRDPSLLANPKLHAKIAVVAILSVNGVLLHNWVMPLMQRSVGRPLFGPGSRVRTRLAFRAAASISAASWWTPVVLGAVKEFNFAAPMWVFLLAYAALTLASYGALAAIEKLAFARPRTARNEPEGWLAPAALPVVTPARARLQLSDDELRVLEHRF